MNPMRKIYVDKVTVNIGVGESGQRLVNAEKVLELLTGQKPVRTYAKRTIQTFGIRKGEPIGCKVTLRGERAVDFLRRAFPIIKNRLSSKQFDNYGAFSFGIEEHIDFPDVSYNPEIGIFGMDVCVFLARPGYRVARRKIKRSKIGSSHRVTKEEAIKFITEEFGVEVV
jgi:large subunit ribosomal protein L5